jgi:hypothetical protein
LEQHPEELDAAINLVFSIESTASRECEQSTGLDKALEILAKHRRNGEQ